MDAVGYTREKFYASTSVGTALEGLDDVEAESCVANCIFLFLRDGMPGALWLQDFDFKTDFLVFIKPDVLKRTRKDRLLNPETRPYSVPADSLRKRNQIVFIRSFVEEFEERHRKNAFIFSPNFMAAGKTNVFSSDFSSMAELGGIELLAGILFFVALAAYGDAHRVLSVQPCA